MISNRIRKKHCDFYLLDEEYEVLCMKAEEAEMTKSEYIRNVILYGAAHRTTNFSRDYQKEILTELSRIGNNINQFTKVANSTRTASEEAIDGIKLALSDMNNLYFAFVDE